MAPRFSRDGTRVFDLDAREWVLSGAGSEPGWIASSSLFCSLDVASGKTDGVLPGVSIEAYDVSRDETEVVYTTKQRDGTSQMWLAALDRRTAPRLIGTGGDQVSFGADGGVIFRSLLEDNALVWIKKDGTNRQIIKSPSVLDKLDVSPDGEWVLGVGADPNGLYHTIAVPIRGGAVRNTGSRGTALRAGPSTANSSMRLAWFFRCRPADRCQTCPRRESTRLAAPRDCPAYGPSSTG